MLRVMRVLGVNVYWYADIEVCRANRSLCLVLVQVATHRSEGGLNLLDSCEMEICRMLTGIGINSHQLEWL